MSVRILRNALRSIKTIDIYIYDQNIYLLEGMINA